MVPGYCGAVQWTFAPTDRVSGRVDVPMAGQFPVGAERIPMVLRVPVAAAVSSGLCLAGHVLAGAGMPSLPTVALASATVAVLWSAVARRELTLVPLIAVVWAAQLVGHLLLVGSGGHPDHHLVGAALGPDGAGDGGARMVAMHAVAGIAAAWWLRRGEQYAWRVARRTAARVLRVHVLRVLVRSGPATAESPGGRQVAALHSLVERACPARRGPPRRTVLAGVRSARPPLPPRHAATSSC